MKNQFGAMFEVNPMTSNAEFLRKLEAKAIEKHRKSFSKNVYSLTAGFAAVAVAVGIGVGIGISKNPAEIPITPAAAAETENEYSAEAETVEEQLVTEPKFDAWEYTEGMNLAAFKKYAKEPVYNITTDTFEDIDFEVKGVIGDGETTLFAIIEATAANGFKFAETGYGNNAYNAYNEQYGVYYADSGINAAEQGATYGIFNVSAVNEEKAVIVFGISAIGDIKNGIDYKFEMGGIGYNDSLIPGVLEFTANANFDSPEQIVVEVEGNSNIKSVRLTPFALAFECDENIADQDIYFVLSDGGRIKLNANEDGTTEWRGNLGSVSTSDGKMVFFFHNRPFTDYSEYKSVIVGGEEIPLG